ncbi:hypothetical protein ACIA8G_23950 [Lentzea sp. NPDC051213]|uniref:hypothetical protein n=1 Tax=Lentzea sp. NPDC051213 TaxID=3364126 RepID=UPI003798ADFE
MRKILVVAAGCLALTGCTSNWHQEVTYEVTNVDEFKISPTTGPVKRVQLELVGSAPSDAPAKDSLSPQSVDMSEISGGPVEVGDQVRCTAKQHSRAATQTNPGVTQLSGCKKA